METPDPERGYDQEFMALLRELPAKQYKAVVLVYGEGLSHSEAAAVLGCAVTTVSWRVFTAKKQLKVKAKRLGVLLIVFIWRQ